MQNMKEINGTVTLAYVEEDNKQRVIFRVFPLCTREGEQILGSKELYPDDGSLRVVPDKREQSTFKERMREIGGLCAINLVSDGRELVKVRQNRNYAPDQGERNQMAIYSDVICEFAQGACFEVVDAGADASNALTPLVLIQKGMMLVGPVAREAAASAVVDELKPFGDDSFLLHQFATEMLGNRRICWNPESLLNWRQRRSALRRKERGHVDEPQSEAPAQETPAAQEKPANEPTKQEKAEKTEKAEETVYAPKQERTSRRERKAQEGKAEHKQETKPEAKPEPIAEQLPAQEEAPAKNDEAVLPIGTRLDILDQDLSFDQQLSRLAQPLSGSANRLTTPEQAEPEEEPIPESHAHFNGTPLNHNAKQITHSMPKPQSVHHVVERHMVQSGVLQGENATYRLLENPIERLLMDLEYVWQNTELRERAMDELLLNETFMQDMYQAFRRHSLGVKTSVAAQEQLAEIEAERLDLLMQLDMAKTNEKQYREKVLASLSHKMKNESDRLKREVSTLQRTHDELVDATQKLSQTASEQLNAYVSQHLSCMNGVAGTAVALSPVVGTHYTAQELAESLRIHMNDHGYGLSEDEAISLLVLLSVSRVFCLAADTEDNAKHFAHILLESFGLQSVSAVVSENAGVQVVSLLPEDQFRTPTVTIQPTGSEMISAYGHKTIYVADNGNALPAFCPVFRVPKQLKRNFANGEPWQPKKPASLESFQKIRSDVHPLLAEADKWFHDLHTGLKEQQIRMPESAVLDMRRFMEASIRRVRGGFVTAADIAVCHWVAPLFRDTGCPDALRQMFSGLPRVLEMLHIG